MISLLCPSRGRPAQFRRMVESARQTAARQIEVVAYVDEDDLTSYVLCMGLADFWIQGPRILLTDTWNKCFEVCHGDIVQQANDDCIYLTPGWDQIIENAFAEVPDRIMLAHGDDASGGYNGTFGPHPAVHRKWVEALGYFIAPYFSSDYGDSWNNDLADLLGRRRFLPFTIEHLHFSFGKAEIDQTTLDRLENHKRDGVDELYELLKWKRERDADKLRALMFSHIDTRGWAPPRPGKPGIPCPKCKSQSTVKVDAGRACNACGHQWTA